MSKSTLVLSMIAMFIGHFLVDMMIGIWPVFKSMANIDLAVAGIIGGTCAFFGEGMQVFFGSLCDRGYRKKLILCGLVATTMSVCLVYTNLYVGIFALYFLTCLGSAAFHPSAASLVADLPSENKSLLISIFTTGGYCGMAVSQLIFVHTHSWLNGQVAWLCLPAVIAACCIAFSRIGSQVSVRQTEKKHFDPKLFLQFFKEPSLCMLYVTQVCSAIIFWGLLFLLPDLLHSRGYEDWIAYGGGHFFFVIGSVCMMIPAGYLADYYSARKVILCVTTIAACSFYAILFFPLLDSFSVLALLFCLGASGGAVNPIVVAFGGRLVPHHKGLVGAFLMGLVWCVSEPIGLIGGGFLATCFENDAPAKALAILGLSFCVGLIASYRLPQQVVEVKLAPVTAE